jgi:4-hydroxy-tetrahydrodipicolinate synthase
MTSNGTGPRRPAAVARVRDLLRGRVVAATLTPFHTDGRVAREAVAGYAAALRRGGAGALAVGAHTGRGGRLQPDDLAVLVSEYADASGLPIIAGLALAPERPVEDAIRLGLRLRAAGAAALLVCPVSGASPADIVRLHERLGEETELPLMAFVLYERASGCQYAEETVAELLTLPWVCGVKLALLDNAVACQDILATARSVDPDALVMTGEDRMYGPSLMWGADTALLGIASALPEWSVAVLDAWTRGDHASFVAASTRLDALGRLTFREPMEGYVQRMAWIAAWQGILPSEVAVDPFGPPLPADERERLLSAVRALADTPDARLCQSRL